jgi:hypothetical protein
VSASRSARGRSGLGGRSARPRASTSAR